MNTKKVVISGVTSSLGRHLALMLAAQGYQVVGFSRRASQRDQDIELLSADLLDTPHMYEICRGASAVFHLAALSSPWGRYEDFYKINVEGTRSILDAAKKACVDRFIHVSTPSIYFDFRDRYNISESEPLPQKSVNAYAATKREAEGLLDRAVKEGLACITLRPRAIFGPHDQALFPRLLKVCQQKGIPCLTKRSPLIDITYVENVAHALCLCLEAPSSCFGEKYNITNGEPALLWDLLQSLLSALSIPCSFRKIPYSLGLSAAWFSEWIGKLRSVEPVLTRYAIGVLRYSQTLSIEKAKSELNYKPLINLQEGVRRYVQWHQTT